MSNARRVQPAREVAFAVLRAVAEADAYANLLLPKQIRQAGLSAQDAAFATELTYATLRQRGTYDAIIALAADRGVDKIDPAVLDALRLGAHQLLGMRVATHAAVNETVNLATNAGGRSAGSFANAILRRIASDSLEVWQERIESTAKSDDELLSVRTSHPVWVIRAFRRALAAHGRAGELAELLAADNLPPEVTLVALPGLAEVAENARPYAPTAFASAGGDPGRVIASSGGAIRVQDEGSQLVALALAGASEIQAGERWLDLCAGPGGKATMLAAIAAQSGVQFEANEVTPARAGLVRDALRAVPGEITVHERDGREFTAEHPGAFNRILLDAPCTGLGALRRRPEARWRKSPQDVPELVSLQTELLHGAIDALVPGGIVAYVTCSPHLAETVGVVEDIMRTREGVRLLDAKRVLNAVAKEPLDLRGDDNSFAQLWPHAHNTDAMFLALIERSQ